MLYNTQTEAADTSGGGLQILIRTDILLLYAELLEPGSSGANLLKRNTAEIMPNGLREMGYNWGSYGEGAVTASFVALSWVGSHCRETSV